MRDFNRIVQAFVGAVVSVRCQCFYGLDSVHYPWWTLSNTLYARQSSDAGRLRKNYLFVGSENGGKAAAIAYTLIETAKLNGVDPHRWLADTLSRIPDYKINKVVDLLPWNAS